MTSIRIALIMAVAPTASFADNARFKVEDGRGGSQTLLAQRGLPGGLSAAVVQIESGSTSMLIEYGFECAAGTYAYLGMIHDVAAQTPDSPDVPRLQGYSDSILGDTLRPVTLSPLTDDPYDAPIRAMYDEVCG